MSSHENSSNEHASEIADEKVVQTLYMFAGNVDQQGTPTEEIRDALLASELDSQVAKAFVHQLSSLRHQVQSKRRVARRYQVMSLLLIVAGIVAALMLQTGDVPLLVSLIVAWAAVLTGIAVYVRARVLKQPRLA